MVTSAQRGFTRSPAERYMAGIRYFSGELTIRPTVPRRVGAAIVVVMGVVIGAADLAVLLRVDAVVERIVEPTPAGAFLTMLVTWQPTTSQTAPQLCPRNRRTVTLWPLTSTGRSEGFSIGSPPSGETYAGVLGRCDAAHSGPTASRRRGLGGASLRHVERRSAARRLPVSNTR
ncbi:MAG: hypothetical protein ACR2HP_00665 [Ilumatobacteraceae bacterium]